MRHAGKRNHGFTLIEVVVAITILGLAYSAMLGAFSGSLRLLRQASEYQNALLLARAKLDETWIDTSLDIADQEAEETYGGVTYSYKIEIRDVPIVEKALQESVKLPVKLEEIAVEVFWGKAGKEKNYKLISYKLSPDPLAVPKTDPGAAKTVPPPPTGSANATPPATPPASPFSQGK
ncbi:MAG: type II secretion system protein [Sulfuricellaceae bacterium]